MSAIISDCGRYRYRLERRFLFGGSLYAFFGVNPSTAGAEVNDATVRKWIGFTERWGASGFLAGNPFAYRATDVRQVAKADDPIGPLNQFHIAKIIRDADILVPCWGNTAKVPPRLREEFYFLGAKLLSSGKPVKVFGLTKGGDPTHPLMLPYSTHLQDWRPL